MTLQEIARLIGAKGHDLPDMRIARLLTDSRSLAFPAETLFFALVTDRGDGHRYVGELYRQNLRCFVVSRMLPEYGTMADAAFLLVDDTLQALQCLAAARRHAFDLPVVGITGSNGKTIVKEWLYQLLHDDYAIVRSPRSYNSQTGVPLSVWELNEHTQLGIFEAGISRPGEMERLQPVIDPTIGIFTTLGDAHQEHFSGPEQKAQEKLKLFARSEVLIYSKDNRLLDEVIGHSGLRARLFSWGRADEAALRVTAVDKGDESTQLSLVYEEEAFSIEIPFTDDASVDNALHCVALMLCLGLPTETIARRTARLESVAMRLELKEGVRGCLVVNDSYNSDINSLGIALDFMNRQATAKKLPKTLILSDIMQSGLPPAELYGRVAELVRERQIARFIGIGSELSRHATLFTGTEAHFFATTDDLLRSPLPAALHDELILLKGSRDFRFEDLSAKFERIAHETVLEVNLNALTDNINHFRSLLRPDTKMVSMVKAFAYGSGSVEVARTLQQNRCDYLAVAVADEGVELRREGIRLPVLVMNPEQGSFGLIFDYRLEPEIYSFRLLEAFIAAAERQGLTDYPIHVKIDSGMHRLGFEPQDMERLCTLLRSQTRVKVRSVFSHLAGADDPRFDDFTRRQAAVFTNCADRLCACFPHRILRHLLASSGIERFPEYQYDMVRLGIGHYGLSAVPGTALRPVCSLKTVILQIKELPAGETVGYSRRGVIGRRSRIAVLPIGYADGFDRRLGNGVGEVLINGRRARVVGNVCMDLCMVDVTDIDDVREGDPVEVFGERLPIGEVADRLGTIAYEVLTGVSRRVKRVYFQE